MAILCPSSIGCIRRFNPLEKNILSSIITNSPKSNTTRRIFRGLCDTYRPLKEYSPEDRYSRAVLLKLPARPKIYRNLPSPSRILTAHIWDHLWRYIRAGNSCGCYCFSLTLLHPSFPNKIPFEPAPVHALAPFIGNRYALMSQIADRTARIGHPQRRRNICHRTRDTVGKKI